MIGGDRLFTRPRPKAVARSAPELRALLDPYPPFAVAAVIAGRQTLRLSDFEMGVIGRLRGRAKCVSTGLVTKLTPARILAVVFLLKDWLDPLLTPYLISRSARSL
jgi:hypothetical protein